MLLIITKSAAKIASFCKRYVSLIKIVVSFWQKPSARSVGERKVRNGSARAECVDRFYLLKLIIGIMLLLPWICGILPSHFSIQSSSTILWVKEAEIVRL